MEYLQTYKTYCEEVTDAPILALNLKQKLDDIDKQVYEEVFDGFYESRLRILVGMWEKGEAIDSHFRGSKMRSWNQLAIETGRRDVSLKGWFDLFKKYSDRKQYIEEVARPKAEKWTQDVALAGKESSNILVSKYTGDQEHYTPSEVIHWVREVLGNIDLDPASCDFAQKIVQADKYFTEEENGLSKSWHGNVFLNPPYQMPKIREFTDKLINELSNLTAAILLTNNNTDTLWFHKCADYSKLICFTKGRINFYKENEEQTGPVNGQVFFYFGDNESKFIEIFSQCGLIVELRNKKVLT